MYSKNIKYAGCGDTWTNYFHTLFFLSKVLLMAILMLLLSAWVVLSHAAVPSETTLAMPDHGKSDCVSFKLHRDTNPLDYSFGYACVSEYYCEVFDHSCSGPSCTWLDPGKGARTTITSVPMLTKVDQVLMAPAGVSLKEQRSQWCLVQDGAGHFWALDKWRGSGEQFTLENVKETIVRCNPTDYFSGKTGCVKQ